MLTLINQVLDLSKVEAGRMALSTTNFDLYYLLADLEDMFVLKAKYKNLQLQFDCALKVPQYICTDEMKLWQVLINLISNAIKFTSSGSVSVKVGLNADMHRDRGETTITFEVTDTGVGITAEELENLFQPFPFVQTSSGQQLQQGTGLGLTISREFVRLMGGEITVISSSQVSCPSTSETPSGTTFKFDSEMSTVQLRRSQCHRRSLLCGEKSDRSETKLKSNPQILRMKRINNLIDDLSAAIL